LQQPQQKTKGEKPVMTKSTKAWLYFICFCFGALLFLYNKKPIETLTAITQKEEPKKQHNTPDTKNLISGTASNGTIEIVGRFAR